MSAFPGQLAGVGATSAGGGGAGGSPAGSGAGPSRVVAGAAAVARAAAGPSRVRGGGRGRGEPPRQQRLGHLGGRGGTVRAARRRAGMGADRLGLGPRATEPAELAQDLVQRLPPDVLHDVVGRPLVLAHAEDRHDVGVVQLGRRPRLAAEPLAQLGVEPRVARQDLQRHVPAQRGLLGLVDHAHAAAADLAEDQVVADLADRRAVGRLAVGERAGGLARPGQRAQPLHLDHGREDEADLVGQLGVAVGVLGQGRPLALAIAVEERLGQHRDAAAGRGRRCVGHDQSPPRPPGVTDLTPWRLNCAGSPSLDRKSPSRIVDSGQSAAR